MKKRKIKITLEEINKIIEVYNFYCKYRCEKPTSKEFLDLIKECYKSSVKCKLEFIDVLESVCTDELIRYKEFDPIIEDIKTGYEIYYIATMSNIKSFFIVIKNKILNLRRKT